MHFKYGNDSNVITRFFLHYSGTAPANADLVTFAQGIAGQYGTNLKALAHPDVTLVSVTCTDLTSSSGAIGVYASGTVGTRTGSPLTANAALIISYQIARRYRGGHPRGYWPFGIAADISTEQTWGSTFLTTAKTDIDAFINAILAAGWTGAGTLTHVNVSYYSGFTVVTNPVTHRARNAPTLRGTPITDLVVARVPQALVGSQRRRIGR